MRCNDCESIELSGNFGEWSESYVFLRILGDGRLYRGDRCLNRMEDFYAVVRIARGASKGGERLYEHIESSSGKSIQIIDGGSVLRQISAAEFSSAADKLLDQLKAMRKEKRKDRGKGMVFPEVEQFLRSVCIDNLKASTRSKSDIHLVIQDERTMGRHLLGFSIKSYINSFPTLFNASQGTKFRFRLSRPTTQEEQQILNGLGCERGKVKKLVKQLYEWKIDLSFDRVVNPVFEGNLAMLDSNMQLIISNMILDYYRGRADRVRDLVDILRIDNPLRYNGNHDFYGYKVRKFLVSVALGMHPEKMWNGRYDAIGGYIVVKREGDVLCYTLYDWNHFEEYLLMSTKFDTPSTKRHEHGVITQNNELDLNFQIRFSSPEI